MEFVKSFLNEDFELKMLGVNVAGQFDFRSGAGDFFVSSYDNESQR